MGAVRRGRGRPVVSTADAEPRLAESNPPAGGEGKPPDAADLERSLGERAREIAERERRLKRAEHQQSATAAKLSDRGAALGRQKMDLTRLQRQVAERLAELETKTEALAQAEAKRVEASARLQRETQILAKDKRKLEEQARAETAKIAERGRWLDERQAWLDERERALEERRSKATARKRGEKESERLGAEALWHIRYESVFARSQLRRLHGIERRLQRQRVGIESEANELEAQRVRLAAASTDVEARAGELEHRDRRLARAEAVVAACVAELERARAELEQTSEARHDLAAWLAHQLATLVERGEQLGSLQNEIESIERSAHELDQALRATARVAADLKVPTDAVSKILRSRRAEWADAAPRSNGRRSSPNP